MDVVSFRLNKDEKMLKTMISERNEEFFLSHDLFDHFGQNKVSHFKRLWTSGILDEENKNIIWDWVDTFVILSDRYLALKKTT